MNLEFSALLLAALLTLGACSKDESLKPAPLPSIHRAVDFHHAWPLWSGWLVRAGVGSPGEGLALVPAVSGKAVYTIDARGRLVARAHDDGRQLWKRDTGEQVGAGPVVAYNQVFVGTRSGAVVAFAADDGKTLWRTPVGGEVLAPPAVNGDALAVKTSDGHVVLLDRLTGAVRWTWDGGTPTLSLRAASRPLLLDDAVMAGMPSGMLVALERATGQQIWDRRIAEPSGKSDLDRLVDIAGDFALREDRVYVGTYQGRLVALDLRSGQFAWQMPISTWQPLALGADAVYAVDGDSRVIAVRASDGVVLWRQEALLGRHLTGPALAGDWLLVGDYKGWLHVIRRSDGTVVGRKRIDRKGLVVPPVVDDGTVYVLGRGGKLKVLTISARGNVRVAPAAMPVSAAPALAPAPVEPPAATMPVEPVPPAPVAAPVPETPTTP